VPAATLLLPYFEVELSRTGLTTLFSINKRLGFGGGRARHAVDRPVGVNGPYNCALPGPAWFPLNQTDVVAFDEQENAEDLCFAGDVVSPPLGGAETCFPLEAQRIALQGGNVAGADPTPAAAFGWMYLNLNSAVTGVAYPAAAPSTMQNWVTTVMDATGRFSVGFDAVRLDSACEPSNVIFIP
jgi:hypothetical protein